MSTTSMMLRRLHPRDDSTSSVPSGAGTPPSASPQSQRPLVGATGRSSSSGTLGTEVRPGSSASHRSSSHGGHHVKSPEPLQGHKVRNVASSHWGDMFRLKASVVPVVLVPTLVVTAWAALVSVFYMVDSVNFLNGRLPNSTTLVTILGVVMSLLLVFRTNTSYDRFWEGRRIWATVQTNVRNLTRYIWICVQVRNQDDARLKAGAMNLVLAFAIATKNYLREEDELSDDVAALVAHIPEYAARAAALKAAVDADASADSKGLSGRGLPPAAASLDAAAKAEDRPLSLPMELTLHLQAFTNYCRRNELVDVPVQNQLTAAVSALVDSVTSFERIRSSPIPFAYNIHLKQTLLVYLLSLPFQLLPGIFWATVPAVFLASF
ncbi:hypothetical protein HK405_000800, partial [Cladochytrium tenue]